MNQWPSIWLLQIRNLYESIEWILSGKRGSTMIPMLTSPTLMNPLEKMLLTDLLTSRKATINVAKAIKAEAQAKLETEKKQKEDLEAKSVELAAEWAHRVERLK
ncbi:uncharacterized protein A4U43_C01F20990 [Asparagus officinalis]|uniref:Uncharacterized protein n=1 Tax=Asparagus officinalis TaxID=4686 RepID=A0A5P1FVF0_ASPOF|nr:uncharacterized protein A4U43_C01F20990 [Asparagus officinalis]